MNDAIVVCRQLGYQDGADAAPTNSIYGRFLGTVWLTNLQCTGTEKTLMECTHDAIGNKSEELHSTRFGSVICKDGNAVGGTFYAFSSLTIHIHNLPASLDWSYITQRPISLTAVLLNNDLITYRPNYLV